MKRITLYFLLICTRSYGFTAVRLSQRAVLQLKATDSPVEEYKNVATSLLSNFMQEKNSIVSMEDSAVKSNAISKINFDVPKIDKIPLETLAKVLDYELYSKEWFVTGNVNPIYFSKDFKFQDPDVKLSGIENYARGVHKLFNQETSRAQIQKVEVNPTMENTITVTWRLSGNVKIGPGEGLPIKPYICYTDFKVDPESGLIVFQEDRFDIPQWDILVSALFPFLIGKVTKAPAEPIVRENPPMMPSLLGQKKNSSSKSNGLSMDDVKKYGVSGTVAYVLTELVFWAVAFPVASTALYQSTGHWPDVINDVTDRATVLGFIFAGANVARLLVPVRLGAALALAPWVDEYIINRNKMKETMDSA